MKNNVGVSSSSILLSNNTQEDLSRFDEIKTISKIASHFNVRMDQVELGRGMASIYLDAEEIRRITG